MPVDLDTSCNLCGAEAEQSQWLPAFQGELIRLLEWRRDVRHFRSDALPAGMVDELIALACLAPSVGNSQPWRFVLVNEPVRRSGIIANFEAANAEAALDYAPEKQSAYVNLKLAGLREAPVHLAVFCDTAPIAGHGLGRQTMPEMLEYSVVCAVHTLWLAARARGVGLGWVSILDPVGAAALLDVPPHWKMVAYLCLGWPSDEHVTPELERRGWQQRQDAHSFTLKR